MTTANQGPRIYNLFPLLAGPFSQWEPHLDRAARMGFNWIFVNPFHLPGSSGSIYSVKDYYSFNPLLIGRRPGSAESQLRHVVGRAHALGMQFMMDLVINHTAVDSPLVQEHPAWYLRDADGQIVHPGAEQGERRVIWRDLAAVDNAGSSERASLRQYWLRLILHYADLGVDGFRCDAAYQVPAELWRFLISSAKTLHPQLRFFAETLGCTPEQTLEVARAGFDFVFNSSKWWDFTEPWCLDQYRLLSPVVSSVSFPESHDTERLAEELDGDLAAVRQRYVFAALFSTGVMMPIGFEYGFRKRLHVVNTRPSDWELASWDDTGFIGSVNVIKATGRVWNEEGLPARAEPAGNPQVLALSKCTADGAEGALFLLNKDLASPQPSDPALPMRLLGETLREVWLGSSPHAAALDGKLMPAGFRIFVSEQKM